MTATLEDNAHHDHRTACRHPRSLPTYTPVRSVAHPAAPKAVEVGDSKAGTRVFVNTLLAIVAVLVVTVVLLAFGSGAAADDAGEPSPAPPAEPTSTDVVVHIVQPGDTLWAIAARLNTGSADLRPIVDHLAEVAGGSALEIGQRLEIDRVHVAGLAVG